MHKYRSSFKHWLGRRYARFTVINWCTRFYPNKITFHRWWCWVLLFLFLSAIFKNWSVDKKFRLISPVYWYPQVCLKTLETASDTYYLSKIQMFSEKHQQSMRCKKYIKNFKTENKMVSKYIDTLNFHHWWQHSTIER